MVQLGVLLDDGQGVPLGVMLAAHFGWQMPFYLLVVFSMLIWIAAARALPSLTAHLGHAAPLSRVLPELVAMFRVPAHLRAFLLTFVTMLSGMLVIPFISPVLVGNLGISPADVTWVYLCGGLATLFSSRMIGNWSDRAGKHRVFRYIDQLVPGDEAEITDSEYKPVGKWRIVAEP